MPGGVARLLDAISCPPCIHGWGVLPVYGQFTVGSPNVLVNSRPAIRLNDLALTVCCPGTNTAVPTVGAVKTLTNSRPTIRMGDVTTHCLNPASLGYVMPGHTSPNTICGL
jgi:uncharacterized Zn-binding protein involved in type VI secretion